MPDHAALSLACVDIEWTGKAWRLVTVFSDNSWHFVGPNFATEAEARDTVATTWPRLDRLYARHLGSDLPDRR